MRIEDIDVDALLAGIGGAAVLFPAIVALVTFGVLRREHLGVRIAGAVVGFVFPPLAIVGWFVYPRLRKSLGGLGGQLRDAVAQAKAQAAAGGQPAAQLDLRKLADQARQGGKLDLRKMVADAQREMAAQVPPQAATPGARLSTHPHAPLDPARLLSSDLSVRFNTQPDGSRKLNIPKVVE